MILIHDTELGYHVFTHDKPNADDIAKTVHSDVRLDLPDGVAAIDELHDWPQSSDAPDVCVGRDPHDESRYRVFRFNRDCSNARFVNLGCNFAVHESWADYRAALGRKGE
jgi:hypothetical protein